MKMIEIAKVLAGLDEESYASTLDVAAALRSYKSTFPQTKGRAKGNGAGVAQAGAIKPKRIRRTKAQIEADKLAEAAKIAAQSAAALAGNTTGAASPIE